MRGFAVHFRCGLCLQDWGSCVGDGWDELEGRKMGISLSIRVGRRRYLRCGETASFWKGCGREDTIDSEGRRSQGRRSQGRTEIFHSVACMSSPTKNKKSKRESLPSISPLPPFFLFLCKRKASFSNHHRQWPIPVLKHDETARSTSRPPAPKHKYPPAPCRHPARSPSYNSSREPQ